MKIAFIILTHKNPAHLRRLVERLSAPEVYIFVHLDRGVGSTIATNMQETLASLSKVNWLPRFYTYWGSWGLVQASLIGLEKALEAGCDYALLLSGQDYPLTSVSNLTQFLAKQHDMSFIQYHAFASGEWPADGTKRLTRWYFNLAMPPSWFRKKLNNGLIKLFNWLWPNRPFPAGLEAYGGSQWWCLHRQCMEYVVTFTRQNRQVVNFFKYIRIPDEAYFHTILLNSPLRQTIINRSLTYVDWGGPPFPRILSNSDLAALTSSGCFFARKFDPAVDALVLDQIDQQMLSITAV